MNSEIRAKQVCALPHVSLISEVVPDGRPVYGVEIQVPSAQAVHCRRTVFFWAPNNADAGAGCKEAALQAISYLEGLYGFIVVDYSFQGLMLYRGIAGAAVSVAARAACLLELASQDSDCSLNHQPGLAAESHIFLKEVSLLSMLV